MRCFQIEISDERKARAPLPAGASVDHGVRVVVTGNHRNKAAGRGCHVAACYPINSGLLQEMDLSSARSGMLDRSRP